MNSKELDDVNSALYGKMSLTVVAEEEEAEICSPER